jgi:hypothetical protein
MRLASIAALTHNPRMHLRILIANYRGWSLAGAIVLAAVIVTPAAAQEVKPLGTFGKWAAYSYREANKPVCYVAAKPDHSEGGYKSRGESLFLVTHRPAEKAFDVVSIVAGYQYLPDSDVTVTVGKTFRLFTNADRAWARDTQTDKAIIQSLSKSNAVTVVGTSSRNTVTADTFPLNGFSAAYKAIGDACKKP